MRILQGHQLIWGLVLSLPWVIALGLFSGPNTISPSILFDVWETPTSHAFSAFQDQLILREIRLPRVLLAALIGAMLAIAGAVMQGLFRNPLAEPSLIGATAGASVGASLSIVLSLPLVTRFGVGGLSMISIGAFIGAVITVFAVYHLSAGRGSQATSFSSRSQVATMLLIGIAVSALAGAISHLLRFMANNDMLRRMTLWEMGNLDLANWARVGLAAATLMVLMALLHRQSASLNALLLGESEARALGIDTQRLTRRLIVLTALGVGVSTALAGSIGFVGLVVPHLVRLLIGPNHHTLLPASALLGALLLVSADLLARSIVAPAELPVGVITALIGVPFFIVLIRRQLHGLS